MPSLTPKIIDGHTYYYARYCQRVDGKPKVTRTVYLGKIEDLIAAAMGARQPPRPQVTVVATFGEVAALWHIAGHFWSCSLCSTPPSRPSVASKVSPAASTWCWPPSTASWLPPASCSSPTGIARRRSPACCLPTRPGFPRKTSGTI